MGTTRFHLSFEGGLTTQSLATMEQVKRCEGQGGKSTKIGQRNPGICLPWVRKERSKRKRRSRREGRDRGAEANKGNVRVYNVRNPGKKNGTASHITGESPRKGNTAGKGRGE